MSPPKVAESESVSRSRDSPLKEEGASASAEEEGDTTINTNIIATLYTTTINTNITATLYTTTINTNIIATLYTTTINTNIIAHYTLLQLTLI